MAKITKIKASDAPREEEAEATAPITRKKVVLEDKKQAKSKAKSAKKAEKSKKTAATDGKKPFILIRPFVAFGRYLKASWQELRQVRWPSRKATWKMVLAVLVYTALFMVLITLLDMFFGWFINLILNAGA